MITVAPGKHRRPRHQATDDAASPAASQRTLLTDADWPPSGTDPWPQWDGPPPLLHPDHPSAPVPRVRAPLAPGAGEGGPAPARSGQAAIIRHEPLNQAAAIREAAEQEAAAIRQEATAIRREAAAIREAAEQEAAHLGAVVLSLSEQLSQMSAYITENLASPGGEPAAPAATTALMTAPPAGLATRPTPPVTRPVTRPSRPVSRPIRPASRHARPVTKPGKSTTRPTTATQGRQARAARNMVALLARPVVLAGLRTIPARKPQTRGRQYQAMRVATAATAALFSFAVITCATEVGLHGFKFFTFRSGGTGETAPTVGTDQQFLAQQAAAQKAPGRTGHTPGRHSARSTSGARAHRDSEPR